MWAFVDPEKVSSLFYLFHKYVLRKIEFWRFESLTVCKSPLMYFDCKVIFIISDEFIFCKLTYHIFLITSASVLLLVNEVTLTKQNVENRSKKERFWIVRKKPASQPLQRICWYIKHTFYFYYVKLIFRPSSTLDLDIFRKYHHLRILHT